MLGQLGIPLFSSSASPWVVPIQPISAPAVSTSADQPYDRLLVGQSSQNNQRILRPAHSLFRTLEDLSRGLGMYAQRGGDVVPGLVGEEVEGYDGSFHMKGDLARHGMVKRRGTVWSEGIWLGNRVRDCRDKTFPNLGFGRFIVERRAEARNVVTVSPTARGPLVSIFITVCFDRHTLSYLM